MTSISLPAHLLPLGSKVSMWLTPPHMNRKMTDFALGARCGPSPASGIAPASAQMPPIATPRNPPPAWCRKPRRVIRPHGSRLLMLMPVDLSYIDELIEIEQQPREAFQAAWILGEVIQRAGLLRRRRKSREGDAIGEVHGVG